MGKLFGKKYADAESKTLHLSFPSIFWLAACFPFPFLFLSLPFFFLSFLCFCFSLFILFFCFRDLMGHACKIRETTMRVLQLVCGRLLSGRPVVALGRDTLVRFFCHWPLFPTVCPRKHFDSIINIGP